MWLSTLQEGGEGSYHQACTQQEGGDEDCDNRHKRLAERTARTQTCQQVASP